MGLLLLVMKWCLLLAAATGSDNQIPAAAEPSLDDDPYSSLHWNLLGFLIYC